MVHFPPIPPSLIIRDEDEEDEEEEKEKKKKKKFRILFLEFSDGTWMKRGLLEGKLTYDEIDKIKKLLIDKYNFQLKKATE